MKHTQQQWANWAIQLATIQQREFLMLELMAREAGFDGLAEFKSSANVGLPKLNSDNITLEYKSHPDTPASLIITFDDVFDPDSDTTIAVKFHISVDGDISS